MVQNGVVQHTFDTAVLAGFPIAVITGILPPIAALVSIIYGCIKIYETKTCQSIVNRFRGKR